MDKVNLTDPASWDTALFPVAVAAKAAAVDPATLRIWFLRGNVRLQVDLGDAEAPGAGLARKLSLRSVLTIAATAALARANIPVKAGFKAAARWTGGAAHNGQIPAGLFGLPAFTFLIVRPDCPPKVVGIVRVGENLPFEFDDIYSSTGPVGRPATIISLDDVDRRARIVCEEYLRS